MTHSKTMSEMIAARQLRRLAGLPGTDERKDIIPEVLAMLWRQADDESHAKRAVDLLLQRSRFFPTPAEIKLACDETRVEPFAAWKPNLEPCPDCGGSGWRTVERGGYSAAKRCECGDGKAKKPVLV